MHAEEAKEVVIVLEEPKKRSRARSNKAKDTAAEAEKAKQDAAREEMLEKRPRAVATTSQDSEASWLTTTKRAKLKAEQDLKVIVGPCEEANQDGEWQRTPLRRESAQLDLEAAVSSAEKPPTLRASRNANLVNTIVEARDWEIRLYDRGNGNTYKVWVHPVTKDKFRTMKEATANGFQNIKEQKT